MKQNLLIVSYDYDKSKEIAKILANDFSLRVFDQKELFEFDHLPLSFSEVFQRNGRNYVLKKMKSIIKTELEFDDVVFIADVCFAENCDDIFYKILLSNFVVFLYKDTAEEILELNIKEYKTIQEKEFCVLNNNEHQKRKDLIYNGCSDVKIDITNLTQDEIVSKIVDEIKKYYSVG